MTVYNISNHNMRSVAVDKAAGARTLLGVQQQVAAVHVHFEVLDLAGSSSTRSAEGTAAQQHA